MNKKILYTLLFTSLFLISTISIFVQPAAAAKFSFGVPEAAKGMDLETEVMAYDKDKWVDCLGNYEGRSVNFEYGQGESDANDVGAKRLTNINDWERDDISFVKDHLFKSNAYDRTDIGITDVMSSFNTLYKVENNIGGDGNLGFCSYIQPYIVLDAYNLSTLGFIGGNATSLKGVGYSPEILNAMYAKTYKGTYLERDYWVFTKEDFDSDPDEEEQLIPFIEDPQDIYDAYKLFINAFATVLSTRTAAMTYAAIMNATYNARIYKNGAGDPTFIYACNIVAGNILDSIKAGLATESSKARLETYRTRFSYFLPFAICTYAYENVYALCDGITKSTPDKKTFLMGLFEEGLPAHKPVDYWLERLLDSFNIDKDAIYQTAEDSIAGTVFARLTYHQGGIEVDGVTVTIKYEWLPGTLIDPNNPNSGERSDYEVVYVYGDSGTQSSVTYQDGDDVFYEFESLSPGIPGYEISIFLAATAISAIGLIYVIMKKRRT